VANLEREEFAVVLKPVQLAEILAEAEAFAATLPGDHPMTMMMSDPAGVLVDRERIAQVLHNLLSNAAKYSPLERQSRSAPSPKNLSCAS